MAHQPPLVQGRAEALEPGRAARGGPPAAARQVALVPPPHAPHAPRPTAAPAAPAARPRRRRLLQSGRAVSADDGAGYQLTENLKCDEG